MTVNRLRVHVTVPDGGERLNAEEKAIEKPLGSRSASDTVWVEAVEKREEKIQRNVGDRDKQGELVPAQTEQPAINVAPFPFIGTDLDELDLSRAKENLSASVSAKSIVHRT